MLSIAPGDALLYNLSQKVRHNDNVVTAFVSFASSSTALTRADLVKKNFMNCVSLCFALTKFLVIYPFHRLRETLVLQTWCCGSFSSQSPIHPPNPSAFHDYMPLPLLLAYRPLPHPAFGASGLNTQCAIFPKYPLRAVRHYHFSEQRNTFNASPPWLNKVLQDDDQQHLI